MPLHPFPFISLYRLSDPLQCALLLKLSVSLSDTAGLAHTGLERGASFPSGSAPPQLMLHCIVIKPYHPLDIWGRVLFYLHKEMADRQLFNTLQLFLMRIEHL